jgi:hypothetical protein
MGRVCPHACPKTTVVLPSNVTLRWKCKFFNYLTFLEKLEDRLELDEARAALEETQREGTVPWEQLK